MAIQNLIHYRAFLYHTPFVLLSEIEIKGKGMMKMFFFREEWIRTSPNLLQKRGLSRIFLLPFRGRSGWGSYPTRRNGNQRQGNDADVFSSRQVGKGEFHPLASHRTVRDSLPSYGSCYSIRLSTVASFPVIEQIWVRLSYRLEFRN